MLWFQNSDRNNCVLSLSVSYYKIDMNNVQKYKEGVTLEIRRTLKSQKSRWTLESLKVILFNRKHKFL